MTRAEAEEIHSNWCVRGKQRHVNGQYWINDAIQHAHLNADWDDLKATDFWLKIAAALIIIYADGPTDDQG